MQQQQQQQNPLDLSAIPPISSSARHAGMAAQAAKVDVTEIDFAASGMTVNELSAVLAWYNLADGAPAALPARQTILRNFWLLG
ncbi:hypothetical protein HKX48_005424 [Thoreauomyces humboldtii]|nr:hypothetical protein HKX48_005424 [Thoreauomyces humboldtii]